MCSVACGHAWKGDRGRKDGTVHYRHAAGSVGLSQWPPSMEALSKKQDEVSRKRKRAREGVAETAAEGLDETEVVSPGR